MLLNTPHNPTGKVFTREELELLCGLAQEHDAWVVTDEVYEHLVFDGLAHVPVSTLPGMAERTLTISSAGKTFSLTGWKTGWVTGPAQLVTAVLAVKQFLTYVGGSPFQPAIAVTLTQGAREARITITDNGTGLPEDRSRLFEPYVTTRAKGTGLGLPIVKKIVEEHGGSLALDDAEGGRGAQAVMRLPLREAEAEQQERRAS